MRNLISIAIANTNAFLKKLHLERFLSLVLVVSLFLATQANFRSDEQPIGERIAEKQHQLSQNSQRPKTTGEFLDEADGDVPLGERIHNITRDSAEAFNQFGQGISNSVQESARELKNNVTGK